MNDPRDEGQPSDPLSAARAQIDQARMFAPELARAYRGYYEAFKEAGFSDAEAVYLAAVQMTQNPGTAPK